MLVAGNPGRRPLFEYVVTPTVLSRYIKKRPNASISLVSGLTNRLFERLSTGELDLSISTPPRWVAPPDNVEVEILDESDHVVVAAPHHPVFKQGDFSTAALAQHRWIITAQVEQAAQTFFKQLTLAGVAEPRTIVRTDSVPILQKLIFEQGFLSVTSRLFVQSSKTLFGTSLDIVPNQSLAIPRLVCLAVRKNAHRTTAAQDVIEAYKKEVAALLNVQARPKQHLLQT